MAETHSQSKYVWVPDEKEVFVQGKFVEERVIRNKQNKDEQLVVVNIKGKDVEFSAEDVAPVNPSTFDKVDDLSELTHLNEASVLFNLENRYRDDLMYTYSGLFLVAINPYTNLKIYSNDYIKLYHGSPKEDNKPHVFAVAEQAYQNLLQQRQNQSILVTGESGAGKTENTKKILQYLASITTDDKILLNQGHDSFETKILQSNPILESFGNAQTVRNNNSSRFGKFIKIDFDEYGKINGAHIEWYLLEKSRVVFQHLRERNYHVFYQLLSGMTKAELRSIELESNSILDFAYLKDSNPSIPGVDDSQNYQALLKAFNTVGFSTDEVQSIFKCIAIILHIGNIQFVSEKAEQASIKNDIRSLCKLLGVEDSEFRASILKPKSKAGKEWVSQSKNASQARFILNSLSRSLYEKLFEFIVNRINKSLEHGCLTEYSIGLLDIAGFEIFKHNSFEQLCINYTNEKLQQFFNHHMFVLEQNEYQKENIQWNFVDYGKDLQATIDLIEDKSKNPGILPILDEESILPKSTDESFYSKLITSWEQKSPKFKRSKLGNCFILRHYAGDVEYNIEGWLLKNKDPLNENLLTVLKQSNNSFISDFFNEQIRGGSFRTASNRHREQLKFLIEELENTDPHFVRCIIPNNKKKARDFDRSLILDQLRCNGVLEGIRIARDGYPNRIFFKEFFQRYRILSDEYRFTNSSKKNCEILLSSLHLEPTLYKVGNTKLFFKSGVLANFESLKEQKITNSITKFNAIVTSNAVRREVSLHLKKLQAAKVLKVTFETYSRLMENPWYNLYVKIMPLLDVSDDIVKSKKVAEKLKDLQEKLLESEQERNAANDSKIQLERELFNLRAQLSEETKKLTKSEDILAGTQLKQKELESKWEELLAIKENLEDQNNDVAQKFENASLELTKLKVLSDHKQGEIDLLTDEKKKTENSLKDLMVSIDGLKKDEVSFSAEKNQYLNEIESLRKDITKKESQIKQLEEKLSESDLAIDVKLKSLEKHLATTGKRMQTFVEDNKELALELDSTKKELATKTRLLESRITEVKTLNQKLSEQHLEFANMANGRDQLSSNLDNIMRELKRAESENQELRTNYRNLRQEYDNLVTDAKASLNTNGSEELEDLKGALLKEKSMNKFLNERLISSVRSGIRIDGFSNSLGTEDVRQEFDMLSVKYKEMEMNLEKEIEERKTAISRLRFAEARLASAAFDNQTLGAQLKKIKELTKNTLSSTQISKEFENIDNLGSNQEKLLLEIDFLKRQLSKEKEARTNAENVAGLLHQKVGQITRSDSTADIYKLRYEANEDYVKSLESRLSSTPLKDRTNVINGDLFKHRESFEKYEEELKQHRVETFHMQEKLAEYESKLNQLTLIYNKSQLSEAALKEEIQQINVELKTVENQKNHMQSSVKRYQLQYENSQKDLHSVETEIRAVKHGLRQAEKDIESMTQMIQKLRAQNKQKEQDSWKQEARITDLESQLDERAIEVEKYSSRNKVLMDELQHFKERVRVSDSNTSHLAEIDNLKGELDGQLRLQTELKKEISNLGFQLETLKLDSESKIEDLLKQTQHYEATLNEIGSQKDNLEADKKTLETAAKTSALRVQNLEENLDSLNKKFEQLVLERNSLKSKLESTNDNFSKSIQEREKYSHDVQFLEESLALQKQQSERDEGLIKQLKAELESLKKDWAYEKDQNSNIHNENESLGKANDNLRKQLLVAQNQLADTSEKDAWIDKIQKLEQLLEQESVQKFDEIKKTKRLERIIEELQRKNDEQANIIELANTDKVGSKKEVSLLGEKILELEALNDSKDASMTKLERENAYYSEKIQGLEKEIESWQFRYEKLSERRQSIAQTTEGVFI